MFKRVKPYRPLITRIHFLFFAIGACFTLSLYFYTENSYEQRLFKSLAADVKKTVSIAPAMNGSASVRDSSAVLIQSLHLVHNIIGNRQALFGNIGGLKAGVIQPLTVDLMTGYGACGSYALVMARLLMELGIDARMVQMKVGDTYGGHIIVEGKYNGNWAVFDPLYNLYFTQPDGKLADFREVQQNWEYYKQQVPSGYDADYRYEDLQYTNWNKIPVLMPALKTILNKVMGKSKADTLSLRILVLKKFQVFFYLTMVLESFLIGYLVFYLFKRKNKTAPPGTPAKYILVESRSGSVEKIKPQKQVAASQQK